MKFSLVKKASGFAWGQLRKNTDTWFILSLKVFVMVGLLFLSLFVFIMSAVFLYGFMAITPHFVLYDPSWYVQFAFLMFLLAGIYRIMLHIVSFNNIPASNALDVACGKPLRLFKDRIQLRSLLFVPLLQGIIVGFGFLLLIIPGFYFAARLSLARNIVLEERCGTLSALRKSWDLTQNNVAAVLPVIVWAMLLLSFPITRILNIFFPYVDLLMSYTYISLKQK